MSKKSLIRFYVRHSGISAELFAVHENASGDLTIKHRPIFYERKPFNYLDSARVTTEYYSVHVSPSSTGHTITHTTEFERDEKKRKVWFVNCEGGPFVALLYSRRHTSLIERLFKMSYSEKDRRIRVAEYDVGKNSLITHVIVTGRDALPVPDLDLPWDVISHQFRVFDIHVVKAFIRYPSLEQGCHSEPASKSVQPTLLPKEVLPLLEEMNKALCSTFFPRAMTEIMNQMGPTLAGMPLGEAKQDSLFMSRLNELYRAVRIERSPAE